MKWMLYFIRIVNTAITELVIGIYIKVVCYSSVQSHVTKHSLILQRHATNSALSHIILPHHVLCHALCVLSYLFCTITYNNGSPCVVPCSPCAVPFILHCHCLVFPSLSNIYHYYYPRTNVCS